MIILLEGLPGAGKSTQSGIIHRALEQNSIASTWIHELYRPHPVLFFDEASLTIKEYEDWREQYDAKRVLDSFAKHYGSSIGIDLLEIEWHHHASFSKEAIQVLKGKDVWSFPLSEYVKIALEKWQAFAEEAAKHPEKVYILDSCIFQYQIFTFLLVEAPKNEMFAFIDALWEMISGLNPHFIYLYRENFEDQLTHIKNVRGERFFQNIWERDRDNPYYQNRPYGVEAYYAFLKDYDHCARELFHAAPCPKISLEVTEGNWEQYKREMFKFLNMEEQPEPNYALKPGSFENADLDLTLKLEENDGAYQLVDPNGGRHRLHAKSHTEWYIRDIPVNLIINDNNRIVIGGANLTNRWTESGLKFNRVHP